MPRDGPRAMGLGVDAVVGPHLAEVRRLARSYGIGHLRVFGSVARGEATRTSDIDVLFDSGEPLGLLRRLEFHAKLEKLLGRKVDLVREEYLHWYVKPYALAESVPL